MIRPLQFDDEVFALEALPVDCIYEVNKAVGFYYLAYYDIREAEIWSDVAYRSAATGLPVPRGRN